MKIAYFHPYFYKGIVLKNRGQNQSLRYFCLGKVQKHQFSPLFLLGNRTKNRGPKLPIFQFYDTFIVQNFKNSHFCPNNYKGIVLKIGVQNGLF